MSQVIENSKLAYVKVGKASKLMDKAALAEFIDALPSPQKGILKGIWEKGSTCELHPSLLWENHSGTVRIIQALGKKNLTVTEDVTKVLSKGGPYERTVADVRHTVHPLVAEIFEDQRKARAKADFERHAARDAEYKAAELARDTENRAIKALVAAHSEEYANLLRNIEAELREERGL